MQGVYRIRNKIDDMRYVGSAQDFDERWGIHRKELQKGNHYNKYLQRAWNKYGGENFVFEIEEEVKGSRKDAFDREQVYLDEGFELGILYNAARTAGGGDLGEEVYKKRSQTRSGKNSPMYGKVGYWRGKKRPKHSKRMRGENNPNYGQVGSWAGKEGPRAITYPAFYNAETEEFVPRGINFVKLCHDKGWKYPKMYDVKSGRTICTRDGWCLATAGHRTEEFKTKMREIARGENNGMYGKHHSKETRAKLSKTSAKPYPAFFNIKTDDYIPAGINLLATCRIRIDSPYQVLCGLIRSNTNKKTRSGWRLATAQEIEQFESKKETSTGESLF